MAFITILGMIWLFFLGSKAVPQKEEKEEPSDSSTMKRLEQQYESSRYLTHIARGVGLGFASSSDYDDHNQQ